MTLNVPDKGKFPVSYIPIRNFLKKMKIDKGKLNNTMQTTKELFSNHDVVQTSNYAVDLLSPHHSQKTPSKKRDARCLAISIFGNTIIANTKVVAEYLKKRIGFPGDVIYVNDKKGDRLIAKKRISDQ